MAQGVGFNYCAGYRTTLQVGDGSCIPVYLEDNIQLSILTPEAWLPVAAVARIEANLQR